MSERAYTVTEIDDLRRACETRYLFGTTHITGNCASRFYKNGELEQAVEQIVRTHMIAGHVAQDILDADKAEQERKR